MEIIIDCDEDELILTDEMSDGGFIQIGIVEKESKESRFTYILPKEVIRALKAFID